MSDRDILIIGGGSCGLTCAWLLENQRGINVTLVEKSNRLGGHIDTKRYQCNTQLIEHQPTEEEIATVESLHSILFVRRDDQYIMGFCNNQGKYTEIHIDAPGLLAFLQTKSVGNFDIQHPYIQQFNKLLREVKSLQRVTIYVVERGAEFIGDKKSYPLFHTLCEHLGIELKKYKLTEQFDGSNGQRVLLPPSLHRAEKSTHSAHFFGGAGSSVFHELVTLFNTKFVISDAERKLKSSHPLMTLKEFVDEFIAKGVLPSIKRSRQEFANTFLYPLLGASWGVSTEDIKGFMAHYAMNYLALGEDWVDVPEGLDTYIHKMQQQCQQADIRLNTEVIKLEQVTTSLGVKYRAHLSDGSMLTKLFDQVVMATPANIMCVVMPDMRGLAELKETLSHVRYYPTKIMTHRDPNYVSDYQYIVRTIATSRELAQNTTCKYRDYDGEIPVMRSWVLPGQKPPCNIIDEVHYEHPYIERHYYLAQQSLHQEQGKQGLYFGNIIGGFNDSNESTQSVAIRIAYTIYQQVLSEQEVGSAVEHVMTVEAGSPHFNRFLLFDKYLHALDKLDAASDQLGAGASAEAMPVNSYA